MRFLAPLMAPLIAALLALMPLAAAAQPAPLSFLMPSPQIIVPSQDMVKALSGIPVQNATDRPMPLRFVTGAVSGGTVQGIKMSDPTQGPPGTSPIPQGFLLEVSGVILIDGTEMVIRARNVPGLSADPREAAGQLMAAGARSLREGGALLAVMGGQEGEPMTGSIIMIGE